MEDVIAWPVVSLNSSVQSRYELMRQNGQSHSIAEILACRAFPGVKTDSVFNEGRCNGSQFEKHPLLGDYYKAKAEAAGVSTTGKYYCSGLARFPGDPKAWISDRSDVKRVADENGFAVHGYVEHDGRRNDEAPMPDMKIDPRIVQEEVDEIMAQSPGARREDVEERVTQLRTGAIAPFETPYVEPDAGPEWDTDGP